MILDEQVTAMIPPPDLWGSTGYTANNNKVMVMMVMIELMMSMMTMNLLVLMVPTRPLGLHRLHGKQQQGRFEKSAIMMEKNAIVQADQKTAARGLIIFQAEQQTVLRKERSRRRAGARCALPGAKR